MTKNKNKVVLVTGTSSDLGMAVVHKFNELNYKVYALSRTSVHFTDKRIVNKSLDLTNEANCKKVIEEIYAKERRIDVLVNLAGSTVSGPTLNYSLNQFKELMEVNLFAPFYLTQCVYPIMKKNGDGRIINITSLNGLVSLPNFGLYSASKHALEALGNALYFELAKENIYVTNVAPGAIRKKGGSGVDFSHKPAREKFPMLAYLLPMLTTDMVANKIAEVVGKKNPPTSVVLGPDAQILTLLKRLLPQFLWIKLMRLIWEK